jgi:isopentenyl phosphate kinase
VEQIAEEISLFFPEKRFIIVHGGGSYGHPLAKQYAIRDGLTHEEQKIGFCLTHQAMQQLNIKVVTIFINRKLPVYTISSSSIFIIKDHEIIDGSIMTIIKLLEQGFIPLLYGDTALDSEKRIGILSGDQLIAYLACTLRPERVIFLIDVNGICHKNPTVFHDAPVIEHFDRKTLNTLISDNTDSGTDTTGGIFNKIDQALKMPCPVHLINGHIKGNITKLLKGDTVGTLICSSAVME